MSTTLPTVLDRDPTRLVRHGKITVRVHERTAAVRVTRLDGDGLPIPHTDIAITWSPDAPATVRIPGRPSSLGSVATAARLELPFTDAHRIQDRAEASLAKAWQQFGAPRHSGDAWVAFRDADGQTTGTTSQTLVDDLRDWCTPAQRATLARLQGELDDGRPSILAQRQLGLRLVPVHHQQSCGDETTTCPSPASNSTAWPRTWPPAGASTTSPRGTRHE